MQISDEILEINGENVCEYDREDNDDHDYDEDDDDLNETEYNHNKTNNNHSQIISYIHDVSKKISSRVLVGVVLIII